MPRAVNQTIAWISSVFFSLMVFAAGYGVFSYLAKSAATRGSLNSSTEGEEKSSHGGADHGEDLESNGHGAVTGHHSEVSDEAGALKGEKDRHENENGNGNGKAAPEGHENAEVKEISHERKQTHSHATGPVEDGEHEISADQFKGESHDRGEEEQHH